MTNWSSHFFIRSIDFFTTSPPSTPLHTVHTSLTRCSTLTNWSSHFFMSLFTTAPPVSTPLHDVHTILTRCSTLTNWSSHFFISSIDLFTTASRLRPSTCVWGGSEG